MRPRAARTIARAGLRTGLAAACLTVAASAALAQGWWPFGGNDEPPRPREPVYRQNQPIPAPIPPQAPPPAQSPAPVPAPMPSPGTWSGSGTKNPICLQLEQRLVQESQKGSQSRSELPRIEAEIRSVDQTFNVNASKLDKLCYEYFLFAKTFRNTPQCKDLAREVEVAKRRLADLEAQRQDITGSSGRSYQDDIIRELARNNCGANYVDQARRRDDGGMWQDEESVSGNTWKPEATGVATYRTICVRLCDGYYFPVSFSTLPSHFPQDAEACQSKCAAPVELYYYPNPGGSVDQSVALSSQQPYTGLKFAFRYRKEVVNGCSCKAAEYLPDQPGDKKAEAGAAAGNRAKASSSPAHRADANVPAPLTTGSTTPARAEPAETTGANATEPVPPESPAPQSGDTPAVEDGWQPQQ